MQNTPPHNTDAEMAVLGTILLDGEVAAEVINGISPDDFYKPGHQVIARAIADLFTDGQPIELITVAERLRGKGEIDRAGGEVYLASLTDRIPMASAVPAHVRIIREKAQKRRLIAMMSELVHRCYTEPLEAVIEDFQRDFFRLTGSSGRGPVPISRAIGAALENIIARVDSGKEFAGLPTGFYELDRLLNGLHRSDLIVLGARPSMGKTALALNIALHGARNNARVLFFSLEMSTEQLFERILSTTTGINSEAIRRGMLNAHQVQQLQKQKEHLTSLSFKIDDTAALSVQGIRGMACREAAKDGLDLILVDYLQLIKGKGETREREVAEVSAGLKALAKDLDVPVLALSQLNRGLESRVDKRPTLADLRDSGAIEQDADVILFLYRDEVYNKSPENPKKGFAELDVAKHRNGRTGVVRLKFDGHLYRFRDCGPQDWR